MASDFPACVTAEVEHGSEVLEFVPSQVAGETAAKAGELVYYDTATQTSKRCGADPSLIAGISEVASESARVLTPDGKVPLRCLKPNATVRMCSATTPAETHVGVLYGVVRLSSGNWAVDISDTSNTRVLVVKVDIPAGAFFVKFVAANLQYDAIAS
jgi:hypothetical protein